MGFRLMGRWRNFIEDWFEHCRSCGHRTGVHRFGAVVVGGIAKAYSRCDRCKRENCWHFEDPPPTLSSN